MVLPDQELAPDRASVSHMGEGVALRHHKDTRFSSKTKPWHTPEILSFVRELIFTKWGSPFPAHLRVQQLSSATCPFPGVLPVSGLQQWSHSSTTEISEAMSQNKSFLLQVVFLLNLVTVMKSNTGIQERSGQNAT